MIRDFTSCTIFLSFPVSDGENDRTSESLLSMKFTIVSIKFVRSSSLSSSRPEDLLQNVEVLDSTTSMSHKQVHTLRHAVLRTQS